MTPAAWQGRPVMVTGHTGFKGTWLCWWLSRLGARVSGFALDPTGAPSLFEATGLAQALADGGDVRGDVRDLAALDAEVRRRQPEVIFHLAAQSLVRESYRMPVETFATNVVGTVHCLEAARRCSSVRAVVIVTTDKCYRNEELGRAFSEDDELGGRDPYSSSKACAELATHAYRASFFDAAGATLVASARAGNVIGGGDWAAERLVPDAARAFAAGRALEIRHPEARRPWQHVLDPLRGYIELAEHLLKGERWAASAWNFGPAQEDVRSVGWVADRLAERWGGSARWTTGAPGEMHEAAQLALDAGKARRLLGWRPALDLGEALAWVVEWYRGFADGQAARELTLGQIGRYEALRAA